MEKAILETLMQHSGELPIDYLASVLKCTRAEVIEAAMALANEGKVQRPSAG